MKKLFSLILTAAAIVSCGRPVTTVGVIPEPNQVSLSGRFTAVGALSSVSAPSMLSAEAALLAQGISQYEGVSCRIADRGRIRLSIDGSMGEEEYELVVRRSSAVIRDEPRYAWRGFMVDESRHFFGEEKIRQTLDMMAMCKLNKFHWHLTDAPGWRIEIKSHQSGRRWKGGTFCPMDSVYVFPDNILDAWEDEGASTDGILGFQANLWSEVVRTMDRYDFMTYPRIFALAESGWTMPERKDRDSFARRLAPFYDMMDGMGIFYCDYRDISHHTEPKI